MRILVVEDDPFIREFVVATLREEGYDVIHASNGEEALAWCKRQAADVLITDIRLPGQIDGWQIAERCRERDAGIAGNLRDRFLAHCASSCARKSVLAETLSADRALAGRAASDGRFCIETVAGFSPYRCDW